MYMCFLHPARSPGSFQIFNEHKDKKETSKAKPNVLVGKQTNQPMSNIQDVDNMFARIHSSG